MVGIVTARILRYPTPNGSRTPTNANVAAEIGEDATATWDATTAMDNGLDGLILCSFATSTMTGNTEYAVCPVPHSKERRNVDNGAR